MDFHDKMATYRLKLAQQIAEAIMDHADEGPHSIAMVAVESAELNGLLDPVKELYSQRD